ncbi:hypothetical protein BTO28_13390 [Domibacillus epiphyticus]|uniref:Integrase catalytic domain-containing protein n=1 Tax=Domibacillus epiphyticus TaxID=1714355 RepID=A0A1V2A591_9BACI|nr:hypothetical protein BTO28_13390 [Domibacillus epiphyticus]
MITRGKSKEKGMIMSMSRKGTPADNAPIESFHASLKSEMFSFDNTTTAIVEQIVEAYSNEINSL